MFEGFVVALLAVLLVKDLLLIVSILLVVGFFSFIWSRIARKDLQLRFDLGWTVALILVFVILDVLITALWLT
ncbi:MAG: hypothetical protein BMS9Abin34_135 [Patescibacteria group bacterium]|nr:MAG: hypothetical protein BMS9Abin34_135 [Patescibacteria group bacterium]